MQLIKDYKCIKIIAVNLKTNDERRSNNDSTETPNTMQSHLSNIYINITISITFIIIINIIISVFTNSFLYC